MNTPQDPWQQGGYQQYPQPRPSPGTPSGGYPQQSSYQGGFPLYSGASAQPGGFSAAPPVSPWEASVPPKPATVEAAFWIAVVVPLLATVLFAVEFFLFSSGFTESFADAYDDSEETANAALMTFMAFGVLIFAALTTLWIVFGFKMRAGKDWARISLTVVAGVWFVWAVTSLFSESLASTVPHPPPGLLVVSWTWPVLSVVAMAVFVLLIYLKPSNWFFRAHRFR